MRLPWCLASLPTPSAGAAHQKHRQGGDPRPHREPATAPLSGRRQPRQGLERSRQSLGSPRSQRQASRAARCPAPAHHREGSPDPTCSGKCEARVCCSGEPRSPRPFAPLENPLGRPVPYPCLWQGGEVRGCGRETEEELPHPLRTSVLCPAGPRPGLETLTSPHPWIQVRAL